MEDGEDEYRKISHGFRGGQLVRPHWPQALSSSSQNMQHIAKAATGERGRGRGPNAEALRRGARAREKARFPRQRSRDYCPLLTMN